MKSRFLYLAWMCLFLVFYLPTAGAQGDPYCARAPQFIGTVQCCDGGTQPSVICSPFIHERCSDYCYEGFGDCGCPGHPSPFYTAGVHYADICVVVCDPGELLDPQTCTCWSHTPIIIDVSGNGFDLTDAAGGVQFQFDPNRPKGQTAWTVRGYDGDAFLVLDRNNDGTINDGTELFGNFTPQPPSDSPNGFHALAEFDKAENGGNGDGVIDNRDSIFARLRVWVDANHDGISQPEELYTLPQMGILSLDLSYAEVRRQDRYGNIFRYRAAVNTDRQHQLHNGSWAYDVVFAGRSNNGRNSQQQMSPHHCPGVHDNSGPLTDSLIPPDTAMLK